MSMMYNTKYSKGGGDADNWIEVSNDEGFQILADLEKHGKEMGFNSHMYMEFILENVLKPDMSVNVVNAYKEV